MAKQKKYYETDEFRKMQEAWYARLAEEGFQDTEKNDTDTIIQPQVFTRVKNQVRGGLEYYAWCQRILRNYGFKNELHQLIFELHAEGVPNRDIVAELERRGLRKYHNTGIMKIIDRIVKDFSENYDGAINEDS